MQLPTLWSPTTRSPPAPPRSPVSLAADVCSRRQEGEGGGQGRGRPFQEGHHNLQEPGATAGECAPRMVSESVAAVLATQPA